MNDKNSIYTNSFSLEASQKASSARQLSDIAKIFQHEAEEKAVNRKGAEAQIESNKILSEQREELEIMRAAITALLKHNLEQAELMAKSAIEQDGIETKRYLEHLRFTKIAAWTGIVGIILGVVGIILSV